MHPYWVTFEGLGNFHELGLGAGVTARDPDDARRLIAAAFGNLTVKAISVVDDVPNLEQGHVRLNMGSIFARGVWFPLGHEAAGTPQVR